MPVRHLVEVKGNVAKGYERVAEVFAANFRDRNELGAACCVYRHGEKVVDLWGGIRNRATGEPWLEDTMVVIYSATKGLAAMTLALLHARGLLDYDERVCTYWPEFAQNGKAAITLRQLLAHQAGLFAFNEPVGMDDLTDLDRLARIMARQVPAWPPGQKQGYHALTLGFFEGELVRRIDPLHRSLGQYFRDEIAGPLDPDIHIGLPDDIPNSRLAVIESPGFFRMLTGFPFRLLLEALNPRSNIYRALVINPGSAVVLDPARIYARNLEVPAGGGVGTARAIARAYSEFATGGAKLGLRKETLAALMAPARPSASGFHDVCMKGDMHYALGFFRPCDNLRFGHPGAFGAPGAGGAFGYADPSEGIGYAYVTNRMGTRFEGDPRDVALRAALPAAS